MRSEFSDIRKRLLEARKAFSVCANRVEQRIKQAPTLTATLSEQIVGVGIAADWLRRAAEMETIQFSGHVSNDSPWTPSFVETTRFMFTWAGANAVFTRDSLVGLLGSPIPSSEFGRFCILVSTANLPAAVVAERQAILHSILREITTPRLPGSASPTPVTTLHAIDQKYVPGHTKVKGAAKKVAEAVATDNWSTLDPFTLVYAFRNWCVHGNALHGSFGGRQKFNAFVEVLLQTLADIHLATAAKLQGVL